MVKPGWEAAKVKLQERDTNNKEEFKEIWQVGMKTRGGGYRKWTKPGVRVAGHCGGQKTQETCNNER